MKRALLAVALALGPGCGKGPCGLAENQLGGSVAPLYDLEVDLVRARFSRSHETVTVDFVHGDDSVAKVVAHVAEFRKGSKIPLTDGDVYRVTSPDTQFPRKILRGQTQIESELVIGQRVEGCFNAVFEMDDKTSRTLEGAFEATLEEGT